MGLILPQTVTVKWNNNTKDHFINRGYIFTKMRKPFEVNVLDLPQGSHIYVKLQCDSCGKIVERMYREYYRSYCVSKIKKYFCQECCPTEMVKYGINTKLYWGYKENIIKELKRYIQEYGNLQDMHKNKLGQRINSACGLYSYNKSDLCDEMGYDYNSLMGRINPVGYYMDYENYQRDIRNLSIKLGRFPKRQEIFRELHIGADVVNYHGGTATIYKIIPDEFNNSLKDDNGFFNRSTYEYMVAQYLIHNDIKYLREQHPFPYPHQRLKSDFTLEDNKGIRYEIEVWGFYDESDKHKRAAAYRKRKEQKINLYQQHKINLISIDCKMLNTSYENIQKYLYDIFSTYLNLDFKDVDTDLLVSPRGMSEDEIYQRTMKYSNDQRFTPPLELLEKKDSSLVVEITKRYGGLNGFAKIYGLLTYSKKGLWNKDLVFKIMEYMYSNYGKLFKINELNIVAKNKTDIMLRGFANGVKNVYPSIVDAYLDFYLSIVNKSICLKEDDIKYLNEIIIARGYNLKNCTPERIKFAYEILAKNESIQNN